MTLARKDFEKLVIMGFVVLRINALLSLRPSSKCSIRDLFPGLSKNQDLMNLQITLSNNVELVQEQSQFVKQARSKNKKRKLSAALKEEEKPQFTVVPLDKILTQDKKEIQLSKGGYVTRTAANNGIIDGRCVFATETKPLLFVFQAKCSSTSVDRSLRQDEVIEFGQRVEKYITPAFKEYQVVPIFITNRTFSDGK